MSIFNGFFNRDIDVLRATARFMTSSRQRRAVIHHLGAYAQLAAAEFEVAKSHVLRRALLGGVAAALMVVALMLGGVALLLVATVAEGNWRSASPMLWIVPLATAVIGAGFAIAAASGDVTPAFEGLRAQFAADRAVMKDVFGDHDPDPATADPEPDGSTWSDVDRARMNERADLAALAEAARRGRGSAASSSASSANAAGGPSVVVN